MTGQNFIILEWSLKVLELERTGSMYACTKAEHLLQALGFAGHWWALRDKVPVERRRKASLPSWSPPFSSFCHPGGQCDWFSFSRTPLGQQVALTDLLSSLKTALEVYSNQILIFVRNLMGDPAVRFTMAQKSLKMAFTKRISVPCEGEKAPN